jgi:hypothetical protein
MGLIIKDLVCGKYTKSAYFPIYIKIGGSSILGHSEKHNCIKCMHEKINTRISYVGIHTSCMEFQFDPLVSNLAP